MKSGRRVVITGMGALTPLGQSVNEYWDALLQGKSGIDVMTLADPTEYPCRIAGEVSDFDPGQYMNPKEARRMARFSQLAVAAAGQAIADAELDLESVFLEQPGQKPLGLELLHPQLTERKELIDDLLNQLGLALNHPLRLVLEVLETRVSLARQVRDRDGSDQDDRSEERQAAHERQTPEIRGAELGVL